MLCLIPRVVAAASPEINVQRIVDEVRERVRYRQSLAGQLVAAPLPFLPLDGSLVEELKRLTYNWNAYEAAITTGRRLTAPLTTIRRTLRRLLAPVLWQQGTFNASTMQIVTQLAEQLDVLASRHRPIRSSTTTASNGRTVSKSFVGPGHVS